MKDKIPNVELIKLCKEHGTPIEIDKPYGLTDVVWDAVKKFKIVKLANSDFETINYKPVWSGLTMHEEKYVILQEDIGVLTLYHEIGHTIDGAFLLRAYKPIENLCVKYNKEICSGYLQYSGYYGTIGEFIAQVIALFLIDPQEFIKVHPAIYALLRDLSVFESIDKGEVNGDDYNYIYAGNLVHDMIEDATGLDISDEDWIDPELRSYVASNLCHINQTVPEEDRYARYIAVIYICMNKDTFSNKYADKITKDVLEDLKEFKA